MSGLLVDIVTAESVVYSDEVDMLVAPGLEGQLGILPHHSPLMTTLAAGELRLKKNEEEISLAISGGFLEVRPDRVIVLADSAERAEDIDIARAEEARKRAAEKLTEKSGIPIDEAHAEAALRRAIARLKVVEYSKKRKR